MSMVQGYPEVMKVGEDNATSEQLIKLKVDAKYM